MVSRKPSCAEMCDFVALESLDSTARKWGRLDTWTCAYPDLRPMMPVARIVLCFEVRRRQHSLAAVGY